MSENNKALVLSAEKLGSYISDAWQLENDIYTLEQTEKRFREDAKNLRQSKKCVEEPRLSRKEYVPEIESSKTALGDILIGVFSSLLVAIIPALFAGAIIGNLIGSFLLPNMPFATVMVGTIVFIDVILGLCIYSRKRKEEKDEKNYKIRKRENIISKNKEIEKENEKKQREYRLALQRAEIDYKAACKKAELMDMQADKTHEQIEKLCNYRKQFLSVGVIPPDYRSYDCIGMFDQIFRNNLADTMREAVAIYEERVFRGDVIRGMGAILTQLDKLRFSMSGLVDSIERAQSRVDDMRSDFKKIIEMQRKQHDLSKDIIKQQGNMIELQENQQELSKNILEESQATKFGVKAIQRCSEYDTFGYFYTT